jgi:predicted Rossmann fold flavoprotein
MKNHDHLNNKNRLNTNKLNGNKPKVNNYKIAVIGGGPAGIMAAISAAKVLSKKSPSKKERNHYSDQEIVLIEKNETLGKKLLLTGGGRCNITNDSDLKTHINSFGQKSSFLKPSLYNFDNKSLLKFFIDKGLDFKVENQGKVYPIDDDASSVLKVLENYLREYNVKLLMGTLVKDIKAKDGDFEIYIKSSTQNSKKSKQMDLIRSSRVILATGGLSYPSTGSTGDGLKFAKNSGHNLTPTMPGLVPLKVREDWIKDLSGLKLENIGLSFRKLSKKRVFSTGTVLLTHFGLSGPGILDLSHEISILNYKSNNKSVNHPNSHNNSYNSPKDSKQNKVPNIFPVELFLDLIPGKSADELRDKFNLEFSKSGKTLIKNYLKNILPNNFIIPFLIHSDINPSTEINQISRKEKNRLIINLKDLKIHINGLMPFKSAMITCGGVNHKDINSKTMESKLVDGMYFAGEIIEFCGLSGGYNLQMAFSTGYTAGNSSANY